MNPLQFLAAQPGVVRLGSTLLHFLWQGVAIAAVYAVARRRMEASSPDARYLLACVALAGMALAPLVTWCMLASSAAEIASASAAMPTPATAVATVHSLPAFPGFSAVAYGSATSPLLSWVVAIWLAGATALWIRLIGGWILASRLRSRLVHPAPAAWQQTVDGLKDRARVSGPVRLLVSSLVQAPAVVGWLRPVILVPVGALAGLPAAHMEALLFHELAHIRRYDYFVNMLQSAVEALLFYHPAVWWVSGHMRTEREHCCDDAAVAATGDVRLYARALAELSSLCTPVVMAANGGSVVHRIARLLGRPRSAPRTRSATGLAAAAVLPVIAVVALFGQSTPRPTFEAASLKPLEGPGPRMMRPRAGGLSGTVPLKMMVMRAYGVQAFQIAGGPQWAESDRYAIDATAPGNPSHEQISLMLRSLLEDRFQLKVHRETRELPVFNLVIARGGPKLPSVQEGSCGESEDPRPEPAGQRMAPPGSAPLPLARCGGLNVMLGPQGPRMYGGKIPTSEIARMLMVLLDRIVIDKTGLTGIYDVKLDFLADENTPHLPPPPPGTNTDGMSPSIFTALPEQLGLRLESGKGPVEVIVIDHVERPSAN